MSNFSRRRAEYNKIRQRKENLDLRRRLTYNYIDRHDGPNSKNKTPSKGARAIFIEKYKQKQNFESAKQELSNNGFDIEIFGDEVLKKWIDEDRDKDKDEGRE